jgi:hypothetical protein
LGNIQEKLFPHPLTPLLTSLGMARGTETSRLAGKHQQPLFSAFLYIFEYFSIFLINFDHSMDTVLRPLDGLEPVGFCSLNATYFYVSCIKFLKGVKRIRKKELTKKEQPDPWDWR